MELHWYQWYFMLVLRTETSVKVFCCKKTDLWLRWHVVKLCCHTWPVKYVLPPTESQLSVLSQSSLVSSMAEVGPNSFRQMVGISLVTTPITVRWGINWCLPPFIKWKQRQFLFCDQPALSDLCHLQNLRPRNICDVCGTAKGLTRNQDYQAAVYQSPRGRLCAASARMGNQSVLRRKMNVWAELSLDVDGSWIFGCSSQRVCQTYSLKLRCNRYL